MKTSATRARRHVSGLLLIALLSGQGLVQIEGTAFAQSRSPESSAKPEAKADPKADAARHFKRGLELFDDNDFQGALIEFQRAYQILPTYQVLYNIGQVRFQLQDYAGALKSFDRFLTEGGDKVPAERRAELERDIAKLRARVATVDVTTARGAMIYVDDVAMGTAPLSAPLQVSAGRRRLRAVLAGSPPNEKMLELAGGDSTRIDLPIEVASAAVTAAPQHEAEATSSSPPWALWGVAGVLAAGTAVTGVIALSASGKADDIRKGGGSFTDFEDARKRAGTFSVVNDIVGGATVIVVVLATYFTVASGKKSSAAARAIPVLRAGSVPGGGSIGFAF